MMKKIVLVPLCILLLLGMTLGVSAAGGSPKIVDKADLLSPTQEELLEKDALTLANTYDMDVVILTVRSIGATSIRDYADDYFDDNGYGIGTDHSGLLLVLAMDEREWWISTCGDAIEALTDYGREKLMDDVVTYFSDGNYYTGFRTYLRGLDVYFAAYANGEPIDRRPNILLITVVALSVGALAGWITITAMKSSMKTTKAQTGAANYVESGSYQLLNKRDIFLYSNTSKIKKVEVSSSGSSTHRSSSGRRHGGGGGRF